MTFGSLPETQVRSSEHLRLDTVLLNTERHAAVLHYIQKRNKTSQLGYDFISAAKTLSLTI